MVRIILDGEGWGYTKKPLIATKNGSAQVIIPKSLIPNAEHRSEIEIYLRLTGNIVPYKRGKPINPFGLRGVTPLPPETKINEQEPKESED